MFDCAINHGACHEPTHSILSQPSLSVKRSDRSRQHRHQEPEGTPLHLQAVRQVLRRDDRDALVRPQEDGPDLLLGGHPCVTGVRRKRLWQRLVWTFARSFPGKPKRAGIARRFTKLWSRSNPATWARYKPMRSASRCTSV